MTAFNISAAYAYFANHINRKERFDLLRSYSLPVAGSVHPIDWELFGAILTGRGEQRAMGRSRGIRDQVSR